MQDLDVMLHCLPGTGRDDRPALVVDIEHQLFCLLLRVTEDMLENVCHVGHQVDGVVPHDGDPRLVRCRPVLDVRQINLSRCHAHEPTSLFRSLPPVTIPVNHQGSVAQSTALLTDHYELTMLQAALHSGAAQRRAVFEVFARHLPHGRRYGVVAGTARVLDAIERFTFSPDELSFLRDSAIVDEATLGYLASYRFSGNVWGYAEGDVYFPGSPILVVEGTFAEAVLLETVVLSILNHDCAVASAASRMVSAAGGAPPAGRPLIEMGSRRTHEGAAVAAARAAYIAGFASTSNLRARFQYGVPSSGTSAHAFTLVHDSERHAFEAQVASFG